MQIKNLPYCIQKHLQKPEYVAMSNKGANDLGFLFTWSKSTISGEGNPFWKKINNGDYEEFFQKYGGDVTPDFRDKLPYYCEKSGTEYIVVRDAPDINLTSGEVVVLNENDGSTMPYFTSKKTGKVIPVLWRRLVYKNPDKLLVMNNSIFKDDGGFKERHTAKVGDKFKVVSFKRIGTSDDDATSYFGSIGLKMGDIVTFHREDGTYNPEFTLPNGNHEYVNWGCLAPVGSKSDIEKPSALGFTNAPQPSEVIGTEYECIGEEKPYYQIGDIVKYKKNDGSSAPLFYNPRNNKDVYISWVKLKRINSNLNLNKDGNEFKEHSSNRSTELFVHAVSATISYGTHGGGTCVSCTVQKIRLGS